MTALLLRCVQCSRPTDTTKSRNGVCRDCIVSDLTKEERTRYVGLMQRKFRYELNKVVQYGGLIEQLKKAERKLIGKIRTYAPWMSHDELVKLLNDCRVEAEQRTVQGISADGKASMTATAKKVILIPRQGDIERAAYETGQGRGPIGGIVGASGILSGRANVGTGIGQGEHFKVKRETVVRENR